MSDAKGKVTIGTLHETTCGHLWFLNVKDQKSLHEERSGQASGEGLPQPRLCLSCIVERRAHTILFMVRYSTTSNGTAVFRLVVQKLRRETAHAHTFDGDFDLKIMRMRGFSLQFLDNQPENRCSYNTLEPIRNHGILRAYDTALKFRNSFCSLCCALQPRLVVGYFH